MFENVIQGIFSAAFLASILRVTTPILLPSMGALLSARAGVINIGLEGMMLSAAFTGVIISAYSLGWFGPEVGTAIGPWLGMIIGVAIATALAWVLAFFHLELRGDLILSALAINIFGSAATVAVMFELTGDRGNTGTLPSLEMPFIQLPTAIQSIPFVGAFVYGVFNNQSVMTWIAFICVALVSYALYRTPFGMHLRAVGENPDAAQSVGIPVKRVQYSALLLSGMFAGLGGIHMSMGYLTLFQRDMTAGRGYIALATPLLGGGNPTGTMIASMVFGFFDAIAIRIGSLAIPSQLPQMVPYIATVMALVIYALQMRLTVRVRSLRAAEGAGFDSGFWRAVQQLSVLHMFMMMTAIVGVFISLSMFSAPNGFGGVGTAFSQGALIAVVSVVIIFVSLPFVTRVERIGERALLSAGASTLALGVYLGLFLWLFFAPMTAFAIGFGAGAVVWVLLGWRLLMPRSDRKAKPAAA